jgi:uncharacterized BrkB/YihY/UPF0761 family membrane protein
MQLVGERQIPDTATLSEVIAKAATTSQTPAKPVSRETEYVHRAAWKAGVLGAFNVLAIILAIRFTLLVAVIGAIILALAVEREPDPWRLGALGVYALVVVLPTVWLASRK